MPIDPNTIASRKLIVTHADCPDGVASALICKDALARGVAGKVTDFGVLFMSYGTQALADLPAAPGMLFVDFTPPRERAQEFLEAGAVVLDHHRTQRDITELFVAQGLGAYADESTEPGVSGATLAFREVWTPMKDRDVRAVAPEDADAVRCFAEVVGVRDTWQRRDRRWNEANEQAAALRFWPAQMLLDTPFSKLPEKLTIGPVLIAQQRERDEKTIREAFRFEVAGTRVLAFEGSYDYSRESSDISDRLGAEVDLVMVWRYFVDAGAKKVVFSCRSRGAFDASKLAKHFGGGGHRNAAGFTLPIDGSRAELDRAPYLAIAMLVMDFASSPSA